MARRRRNPTFFHEHPWMTFFLGMGILGTIEVIVRGYEPSKLPSSSSSSTPLLGSGTTPQVVDAASHPIVKAGA